MLKLRVLAAAALIAAGSTAALAQGGGGGAGAGGAGGEPPRPSDANPPGALYRGGSGAVTTGRGDNMKPIQTAPTGMRSTAPSSRLHSYSVRRGHARSYSQ